MTHVFISYEHDYYDFAVTLRDELQSCGFQTWFDVDDIVGSTFETKAEAIENAAVVIMCMSTSYKESKTCKKDIVYAEKWEKQIIPICVEVGFIPSGWLGYAAEDDTVIDFSDTGEFYENFEELLKQLAAEGVAPDEVDEDDEGDDEDEEDDEDDDDDEEDDGALVAYGDGEVVEVMTMERLTIRTVKK